MCLIFFSVRQHPRYKLIVAANRDEFYARKTAAATWWPEHPLIVGGRDLEAIKTDGTCGTWMAMSRTGRIAMITNYRDLQKIRPNAPSRGHLVTNFLLGTMSPESYLREIEKEAAAYNGFNLVVGTADALFYFSNYRAGNSKIEDGFHGLSNHLLDTPWPKVKNGKISMQAVFNQRIVSPENVFAALYDTQEAPDDQLPDTGVGLDRERMLSAMFIKSPNYGSRCSTVVTIDQNDHVTFAERVYDVQTFGFRDQAFEFEMEG